MPGHVAANRRPASGITRRRFVHGVLAGGLVAGLDLWRWPAFAQKVASGPQQLSGADFNLVIEETPVNFTGRPSVATTINGSVPGPTLRWREGDMVTIAVANHLEEQTSIHWHGVRTPSDMDGVPGLSFPGISPGETFVYRFPVRQRGTYWYHSHSGYQEQTGHYGPLIIDPKGDDPIKYDREYVVMLSDWTDENPQTVFSNLKQQSDYYNYHQRTIGTFFADIRKNGLNPTIPDRLTWGRMNMSPTDLSDVSAATYTYLMNGRPPAANWTGLFRPGERVRLRFINGSSMTIFDVRIPGLPMTVVQTDGNDVEPVTVDEFRISVAETYDVIVQPRDASASKHDGGECDVLWMLGQSWRTFLRDQAIAFGHHEYAEGRSLGRQAEGCSCCENHEGPATTAAVIAGGSRAEKLVCRYCGSDDLSNNSDRRWTLRTPVPVGREALLEPPPRSFARSRPRRFATPARCPPGCL